MFKGWDEYYFMIGSSAAALIGLLFVVATLSAGRNRSTIETGVRLFTTPLVCHFGAILVLSGSALAPSMTVTIFGLLSGAIAVAGVVAGVWIAVGIARFPYENHSADWFDIWWYGIIPALVYVLLGGASAAILMRASWAVSAFAVALMALLLVTIHNAWDLVTFLAPRAEDAASTARDAAEH
jgi:hypothetical protein